MQNALTCQCGHTKHEHRTIQSDLKITSTAMDSPVMDVDYQRINTIDHCKGSCKCIAFKPR